MRRMAFLGLVGVLIGVSVSGTPASATSWIWSQAPKKGPGVILGGTGAKTDGATYNGRDAMVIKNPDGWGAPTDPKEMSPRDLAMLTDQMERDQAAAKALAEEQMENAARDLAIMQANKEQIARQDAIAAQEVKAMAAAMAAGQPMPGAAPSRAVVQPATAPVQQQSAIKPYVSPKVPIQDWNAINKAKEVPAIKPYVVVPKSQQKDPK